MAMHDDSFGTLSDDSEIEKEFEANLVNDNDPYQMKNKGMTIHEFHVNGKKESPQVKHHNTNKNQRVSLKERHLSSDMRVGGSFKQYDSNSNFVVQHSISSSNGKAYNMKERLAPRLQ